LRWARRGDDLSERRRENHRGYDRTRGVRRRRAGNHRTTTEVRRATAAADVGMRDYCRLQLGGGGGGVGGGGGGGRRGAMTAIMAVFGGRMPVRLVDAGAGHDAPFGCLEVCRLTIIIHRAVGAPTGVRIAE